MATSPVYSTLSNYIRLSHGDQRDVLVEADGEDRFIITASQAANSCKMAQHLEAFMPQFKRLMNLVRDWYLANQTKVRDAYIGPQDDGLLFLVVQNERGFDAELEDSLTDLDLAIANDDRLPDIRLSVLSLPNTSDECVQSFISVKRPETANV